MAKNPQIPLFLCPSPIPVHDNGDVLGQIVYVYLFLEAH
jgi:hypothetical protein